MAHRRGRRKKKKRIIYTIMISVILVLFVCCIGILFIKSDKKEEEKLEQNQERTDIQSDDNGQEEIASYEIETDFCTLYFTESWKEQIEIRYSNDVGYKTEFYGLVKGKDAQHLFDICFNSDDGELLGYLENEDEIVNISVDVMELEFDDSWTQEEIDQVYSMQEEMNFVIDSLSKNDNYVEP